MGRVLQCCSYLLGGQRVFASDQLKAVSRRNRSHDGRHVHSSSGDARLPEPHVWINRDAWKISILSSLEGWTPVYESEPLPS